MNARTVMVRTALCFAVATTLFAQQPYEAELREFEQFVAAKTAANQIPALSVAVMKDDFVWAKGFGLADVENKVPASAESSYRMASVTKPMTAVAVLKLVEQGKIALDAEVQKYVPAFPAKNFPTTVRQLLGHLGGVSHYRDYNVEGHIKEPKSTAEALAIFQGFDLVAEPGTRYNYSSYGYNLLGAVIESASGMSYGEFMRSQIWGPLGMTSTRMDNPRELIPNRVRGYELSNRRLRNSEYVDISSRFAAGGTRSTVLDLIKFIQGLEAGKVLKPDTMELMWTGLVTRDGTETRYGLGWGLSPVSGRFTARHGGSQQETRTELLYLPRERFAIALASNLEDTNLRIFADRLGLLFLGDSWNASFYLPDRIESAVGSALGITWNNGLAYYDRYGKPFSSNAGELAAAFRYFNDAVRRDRIASLSGEDTLIQRGRHQSAGHPFIKVGSYMAQQLARAGADLEKYHREGELAFFSDYIDLYRRDGRVPRRYRFDRATESLVGQWAEDWRGVWTDEVKRLTASDIVNPAVAEKLRATFRRSSILPDFAGELVGAAEAMAQQGDLAGTERLATLALELYPESERANGLNGVLAIVHGELPRGRVLLDKSAKLDPRGYTSVGNLMPIVNFLAGVNPEAAGALAREVVRLHPESEAAKKRLVELSAGGP